MTFTSHLGIGRPGRAPCCTGQKRVLEALSGLRNLKNPALILKNVS